MQAPTNMQQQQHARSPSRSSSNRYAAAAASATDSSAGSDDLRRALAAEYYSAFRGPLVEGGGGGAHPPPAALDRLVNKAAHARASRLKRGTGLRRPSDNGSGDLGSQPGGQQAIKKPVRTSSTGAAAAAALAAARPDHANRTKTASGRATTAAAALNALQSPRQVCLDPAPAGGPTILWQVLQFNRSQNHSPTGSLTLGPSSNCSSARAGAAGRGGSGGGSPRIDAASHPRQGRTHGAELLSFASFLHQQQEQQLLLQQELEEQWEQQRRREQWQREQEQLWPGFQVVKRADTPPQPTTNQQPADTEHPNVDQAVGCSGSPLKPSDDCAPVPRPPATASKGVQTPPQTPPRPPSAMGSTKVQELQLRVAALNARLKTAVSERAAKESRLAQLTQGVRELGAARQAEAARWQRHLDEVDARLAAARDEAEAWWGEAAALRGQLLDAAARPLRGEGTAAVADQLCGAPLSAVSSPARAKVRAC